ncbi:MAG: DUF2203 family protein [Gemmataceae bacterium]|nr:DUF2203 family protein [Gemmataceae bacterium]
MKRHRDKKRPMRVVRLWTYAQAHKALPYLRSITGSLREHWLTAQSKRRDLDSLNRQPGRPNRSQILAAETTQNEKSEAEDRFNDALQELMGIDVFLLDPVEGVVFIPFRKGDELAWFVFEHFGNGDDLASWRRHEDPLETRRPIVEALSDHYANPVVLTTPASAS